MALLPTKKISALPPITPPLTGDEELECVQTGTSSKVLSRNFVLPTDSLITLSAMGGFLPGSRQLVTSPTVQVIDGGPGGEVMLEALFTGALPGNPTAVIGLTAVNGIAPTWMRSDSAPPLSQAIIPTWTGLHTFSVGLSSREVLISSADPYLRQVETDAAADNRVWEILPVGEQLRGRVGNDAVGAFTNWLEVDRTLNVVDSVNLLATTVMVNSVNVRDATNLFNTGTVPAARLPSSFSGLANPTASVGLAAVNGVATTAMRSDAAPALDQGIAPTWTAQHIFGLSGATNAAILVSSVQPQTDWNETDGAANNRRWRLEAQGEQFLGRTVNDANSAAVTWLAVDRTLNVVDLIAFTSTSLTWNGSPLLSVATAFANPTASIGLAVVNGAATTAMRSDAAPALDQTIAPTWTGVHTYTNTGGAILLSSATPILRLNETDAAADNRLWDIIANSEQLAFRVVNDAVAVTATYLLVDRTGTTVDSVTFPAQAIFTLTGATNSAILVSNAQPQVDLNETDGAANNRRWRWEAQGEQFTGTLVNDANNSTANWVAVNRTANTVDSVAFPATAARSFLVGTTAPATNFNSVSYISGAASQHGIVSVTPTVNFAPLIAWNQATAGDNLFVVFETEGSGAATDRGTISYNRGAGLTAYNTTSDKRRKKNIRDSGDSGALIDAIQVKAFEWIDSDVHVEHWLIAQDLYEVFPMAVMVGSETRDWSLDPSKLIPLMVKEIQSLRQRVRAVEIPGNSNHG